MILNYKEEYLHKFWAGKFLVNKSLLTRSGKQLIILDPGIHNQDQGPDFLCARIVIDGIEFFGNVEIHKRSSDFILHRHHNDNKYANLLLHVVAKDDIPLDIETLIIGDYISAVQNNTIPNKEKQGIKKRTHCPYSLGIMEISERSGVLDSFASRRLLKKSDRILGALPKCKFDWDESLFRHLCIYAMSPPNRLVMEIYLEQLKFRTVQRCRGNWKERIALFLGQAGFLEKEDSVLLSKIKEDLKPIYDRERYRQHLQAINSSLWCRLRMHSSSFVEKRLMQLALFFNALEHPFYELLTTPSLGIYFECWEEVFKTNSTDNRFKVLLGKPGQSWLVQLIINAVIPHLFAYGKFFEKEIYCERALKWSLELPAEQNIITRSFINSGVKPLSAWQSQALLELYSNQCGFLNCSTCVLKE